MEPKLQFLKKVFPTIFSLTKHVSHFTLIKTKKKKNIFSNQFFKNFYKLLSPYGTKISIFEKVFPTIFSLTKHVSHFTLIKTKKPTKIFSNQFFKIFYKLLSPYGTKISVFEKSVSDNFFSLSKHVSHFTVDWSQKIDKIFFEPFFQSFSQVIVPLWDQNFNFRKKCFRKLFSLKICFTTFHVD